jgi:hypothetical protein
MNLHCGACMENFDTMDELKNHLESCPAAKILLPYIYIVSLCGADAIGHPVSHFLHLSHKHAPIIKRYAYAIADKIETFERSKIHSKLCDDMGIEYDKFRPFESNEITEIPNRQEAEEILWYALVEYFDLNKELKKQREREKTK